MGSETSEALNMSNKELLIRIDERVKGLTQSFSEVKVILASKVENDQEYKELTNRISLMWDDRNRVKGFGAAWGLIGGVTISAIFWLLERFGLPK